MDEITGLKVVGLPLLVGMVGWCVARRCGPWLCMVVAGLTVVVSCIVVQGTVVGWPSFPPKQSLHLLPLLVGSGALLSAMRGRGLTMALASLLALAPAWFLLGRLPDVELSTRALWAVGTAVTLLLLWTPTLAESKGALAGPGVLAVVAGGAAIAAIFSHSVKLAEITGGLAVCLGLIAVLSLWRPHEPFSRGASLAGSVALGALLVYGQHFLSMPPLELSLLLAGWATLHMARLRPAHPWTPARQLRQALLAALPVIAAVVVGLLRYTAEQESNPYY